MPAFVSRTRPVGWTLGCIHSGTGALGLRAILGADIHQSGVLEIQIAFAAPILAGAADFLSPLKFRNGCFLSHGAEFTFSRFQQFGHLTSSDFGKAGMP